MHQPYVEPCFLGKVKHQRGAQLQHRGTDRACGHDLACECRGDAISLGEEQALGEGQHLHSQADVDGQLERQSLAVAADPGRCPEYLQYRLGSGVGLLVPADHDGECARLHLGHASGHRRIEHGRPARPHAPSHLPARARAHRAQVHPDLLRGQTLEDPVAARADGLQHNVVGDRGQHDVCRFGHLSRRVAPAQALVHQTLGVLPGPFLAIDLISRGQETGGHVAPHVAEADKADLRGCGCRHLSPSLRSWPGRPQSARGSLLQGLDRPWPGRRKPTMAPGLRRAQATATAPGSGVVANGTWRNRSTSLRISDSWDSRKWSLRRR